MHALILGSKEYPVGTSDGSDPSPSGGMEIYVQGLAKALSSKGIRLTVLTRFFSGTKKKEARGNVNIIRVPFIRGFYLRNPSFNFMAFLRSLLLDFDIIISNGEVSNLFGLLLSRIKRRPIVMVSHGLASSQPQYNRVVRALLRICDRITYNHADAVITHAPWQMKNITQDFHVVMPGFDGSMFKRTSNSAAKKFRATYAKKYECVIVYTGRIIAVKGVDCLIKSLKGLKQRHVCIIVGDGPEMEKCKNLARAENANVVFLGYRKNVADYLSIADVFVLPSFSESLNYSLVEAAHMGVPIVCTDIGIIKSNCAVLAKPGDEESLARAIDSALAKADMKKISNAKNYASGFDWNKAAGAYAEIMKGLVK